MEKEQRIWATKLKQEGTEERTILGFVVLKKKKKRIHGDKMGPISFEENKKIGE